MTEVYLVNVPFEKKQSIEPEEERFIKAYVETNLANLSSEKREEFLERKRRIDKMYQEETIPVYDIPDTPQWITRLSAVLGRRGIDHSLLDLNINGESELDQALESASGGVFLISSFTNNAGNAARAASKIKSKLGESARIVYGGHHASFLGGDILNANRDFDVIVRGEGEETLDELLGPLADGGSLRGIYGITFREGDEIIINPNRALIKQLGDLPLPNLRILSDVYALNFYGRIFTSRGCPMSCSFCAETMWNKSKPRFFPLDRAVEELELTIEHLNPSYLFINDENFVMDKKYSRELAQRLAGYDLPWSCQTRVNLVDEDLFKTMADSNCQGVFYGVESGSQEVLDKNCKKINIGQVYKACKMAKSAGLQVNTNWLIGLAGETEKSAEETIRMAEKLIKEGLSDRVEYYIAVPYPGTPLYRRPDEFGIRIRDVPFSEYREDRPSVLSTKDLNYNRIFQIWKKGLTVMAEAMEEKLK